MRKLVIPLTVLAIVAGYQGYRMFVHPAALAAPVAEGMTAATVKRPAVSNPDMVDFGKTVHTVDNYALRASEAGKDQPLASSNADAVRDRQIDSIVNSITDDNGKVKGPPASPPAVPKASHGSSRLAPSPKGTTSATREPQPKPPHVAAASDTVKNLPPPVTAAEPEGNPMDDALKAYERRIVPRPRWRREHDAAMGGKPPQPALPRGI